jgi:HAD superfamily hydrolase (TIGR01450 family)
MSRKTSIGLDKIKAVGIDLDGVVYLGNKLAPGAAGAIEAIRRMGLRALFVTNNSVKSRAQIAAKLEKLGVKAPVSEIFTSGYAAAGLLKRLNKKARILALGAVGLKNELRKSGLNLTEKPACDFLLVGLDLEFSYAKISLGLEALKKGAKFIACNRDADFPVENNRILPGCNAMVGAIEAASGKKPDYIAGKPNTFMLDLISRALKIRPEEILIIGDMPQSDILMANRFGCPSILISRRRPAAGLAGRLKPKLTAESLSAAAEILRKCRKK